MRILLIHTGGTIGMAPGPDGLAPQKGLVEQAVHERLPQGSSLDTFVFDPLLDSSNVGPQHWNEILRAIRAYPQSAVIITHGTDTMAFTGAALTQALAGEDRKVVLCGSMLPLGQRGDAEENLDLALQALSRQETNIQLAFAGKLMSAAGLVKHHSHQIDAFRSQPQEPALPAALKEFAPLKLAVLTLSPGLPAAAIEAALSVLDGAVLRIFGSGTAPDDADLVRVLQQAMAAGKRIRAVSQCEAGGLSPGTYAAGAGLWSTGIQNGGAETPEAALIHLWLN